MLYVYTTVLTSRTRYHLVDDHTYNLAYWAGILCVHSISKVGLVLVALHFPTVYNYCSKSA